MPTRSTIYTRCMGMHGCNFSAKIILTAGAPQPSQMRNCPTIVSLEHHSTILFQKLLFVYVGYRVALARFLENQGLGEV